MLADDNQNNNYNGRSEQLAIRLGAIVTAGAATDRSARMLSTGRVGGRLAERAS
jgi:hypothetical protein